MFLLCSICLILVSGCETSSNPPDGFTETDGSEQQTPVPQEQPLQAYTGLSADDKNDEREEAGIMVYGDGVYKVGTDIPTGEYMATNDSSAISKVTIKSNPEPETEKPEIIITSRYLTARRRFTERNNYVEAISKGGGIPVMPNDDPELAALLREGSIEYAEALAERYDGLVLSGGGDVAAHFFNQEPHPASGTPDVTLDIAELALARAFIAAGKPILGICRGMQIINIAVGGELIQDIPDLLGLNRNVHQDNRTRHPIDIEPGTWLFDLFGSHFYVNSTHHQCVDGIPQGFTLAAQAGPVIEAMESGNILCVQFHPERMLDEGMLPLFEDFVKRCSYKYIKIHYITSQITLELKEGYYIHVTGASLR